MKYCKRCLYPENHPLNILFDEDGICSGCRIHEEKDSLDWSHREKKLRKLLNSFKSRSNSNYDCIIPVSGGRDSYFIVDIVKNKYGMNPLLVSYNKQYNTETGIRNLANLRIQSKCDFMNLTVNPETIKKITRVSLDKMGSMYWHCLAGQTAFPVQTAVRYKIPLIIWGVHQGVDQVGMFSHTDEVEMTRKYRKNHDLMGFEAEDMVDDTMGLKESHLKHFYYPHDKEIEKVGVRGIYLSNYIRWDTKNQHEEMIQKYGYKTFPQTRTFDTYNDVDCHHYSDLHDYIKYLKFGFGKITDHVCREIRLKRLTRLEGINLVKKYVHKKPRSLDQFLSWIGITENGFNYLLNQHRDLNIWNFNKGNWKLRDCITRKENRSTYQKFKLNKVEKCNFKMANSLPNKKSNYVLIGRGFVEN